MKAKVLARCMNATKDSNYASSNIHDWDMEHEDGLYKIDAWKGCVSIAVDQLTPSDSKVWPLAAQILHIESKSSDTKDLMELGKSIAKTQELLMGMNEPRPSNDLLWEAWWNCSEIWGCSEDSKDHVKATQFAAWLKTIGPDPLAADIEIVNDSFHHANWGHKSGNPTIEFHFSDLRHRDNFQKSLKRLIGVEVDNG